MSRTARPVPELSPRALAQRDRLVLQYQHLAAITVGRLHSRLPAHLDREDLVGAAHLGLIKAATLFDPNRGVKFETYAITLMRGAILEQMRETDWVPRTVRDQDRALQSARLELEARLQREPTLSELAEEMGMREALLEKVIREIGRKTLTSLEEPHGIQEGRTVKEMLAEEGPSPCECIVQTEQSRHLEKALERLPERERHILRRYYEEEETFRTIGETLQISESRAFQLHRQALNRLRRYVEGQEELFR
jgi:RNA polymerase sigma factor for flagellar operon FliA